jgi:hypothetical protein
MIYFLLVILLLLVAFLLLRLRVRVELTENRRILFAGLGRSGVEIDFLSDISRIKMFGFTVRTIHRTESDEDEPITSKPISLCKEKKPPKPKARSKSSASITDILKISLKVISASWKFVVEIFKSIIVEEAEADIHAGFETPDMTGQVYGYYQAAIYAIPSFGKRVRFYPDWMGASFTGRAKLSLALPVYALVYRLLLLLMRLPILKIIRLIRAKQKGAVYAK